jgi:hypothetical protein
MKAAMGSWLGLSVDSLNRIKGPVGKAVLDLVNRHFKAFDAELLGIASFVPGSPLRSDGQSADISSPHRLTVSDVLEQLFKTANTRIDEIIELESTPFTLNDLYFSKLRDEVLTNLKRARTGSDAIQSGTNLQKEQVASALAALAQIGYTGVTADHLPRLLGPAKYEEALDAAAQTVAYWNVAYKVRLLLFHSLLCLPPLMTKLTEDRG